MSNVWPKPGSQLTKREMQICDLIARGYNMKQIGRQLQISYRTVEDHRLNAYARYGVHNIMELFQKLTAEGMACPCCGRTAE